MSRTVRCAIYTRKSTDEGLDQSFNSLDAQREACEAYVRSQAGEGWNALPAHYDDGGYSGGTLDRPAMQRLLDDIDAGKVDVIVVYKVDRLTRSLMDFAKIVERLDARGVSFVSVTQAFNTTTSMGRLTLNVLLSFAQFEREVTGERIRDKIAASKARGMWMGGNVPLGYDLGDRQLLVNPAEAGQVRHIFTRYLELGSGVGLMHELRRDGIVSKRRVSRSGRASGGVPFSCGALYHLLQNRLYRGEIVHRGVRHAGDHEAIVDRPLFDEVQEAIAANRQKRRKKAGRREQCLLAGIVRDPAGKIMTTSFSYGRGGRLYRYYVAGSLDPARPKSPSPIVRVPAGPLERLVLQTLASLVQSRATLAEVLPLISAVELRERSIQIVLGTDAVMEPHEPVDRAVARLQPLAGENRLVADGDHLRLIIDRQPVFRGGKVSRCSSIPPRHADGIALLRSAHSLLAVHSMSPLEPDSHRHATAPSWQRQRRILAIGLLAPQLQKAILQGRFSQPADRLFAEPPPLAWSDQAAWLTGR
jgi:DNA invertase Pin-like site-specific DNA recombinase